MATKCPSGCQCQPERPNIVSAPLAPTVIAKGLLANSFLAEVLVLKFLYHVPLERIRAMARSAGLALSAGTLCGALEKLTPLFAPLYARVCPFSGDVSEQFREVLEQNRGRFLLLYRGFGQPKT